MVVDRMSRVEGPAVLVYFRRPATKVLIALIAIMAGLAKALQFADQEPVPISAVRNNMIRNSRRYREPVLLAHDA